MGLGGTLLGAVLDAPEAAGDFMGNVSETIGNATNTSSDFLGTQIGDLGSWADSALPGPDMWGDVGGFVNSGLDSMGNLAEFNGDILASSWAVLGNGTGLVMNELDNIPEVVFRSGELVTAVTANVADGRPWDEGLEQTVEDYEKAWSEMKPGWDDFLTATEADLNDHYPLFDEDLNAELKEDWGLPTDLFPKDTKEAIEQLKNTFDGNPATNAIGGPAGLLGTPGGPGGIPGLDQGGIFGGLFGGAGGSGAGSWQGMNVEAVKAAAQQLQQQASRMRELVGKVDGELSMLVAAWHGKDASDFAQQWQGQYRPAVIRLAQVAEQMAQTAMQHIGKQQATSNG